MTFKWPWQKEAVAAPTVDCMRYLVDLMNEIEAMDPEAFPPNDKFDKSDEKYIGQCPEELRKYFAFMRFTGREIDQMNLDLRHATEGQDELRERIVAMNAKRNTCSYMFWGCLNETFGTWRPGISVGIREGWKIVTSEAQDPIRSMFSRLFGG